MNSKVKSVPVQGLDRSSSAGTVKDGSAQEIINLRPLNGVWRNKGEQVEIEKFYSDRIFQGYTEPQFFPDFYRHPSLPEFCYVSYWVDTKTIELYAFCSPQTFNPNWNALSNSQNWVTFNGFWNDAGVWDDNNNVWHDSDIIFTIPLNENFKCFAHLNNILIVTTDKNRYYFLWNAETLTYLLLSDLPILNNIKASEFINPLAPPSMFHSATGDGNIAYNEIMGLYYKFLATEKAKGYLTGYIASRLAYKLYDNTYIPCSEIFITKIGKTGNGIFSFYNPSTYETAPGSGLWFAQGFYMYNFAANSLQIDINISQPDIDIIKTYIDKGIIQSLNILCSREFDDLEYGNSFADWQTYPHSPIINPDGLPYVGDYYPKQKGDTEKLIEINNVFYDIFSIESISLSNTIKPLVEKSINIDNIETYENVTFDSFYNTKLLAESYFNYNERLHLSNITNIIGIGTNNNERNILSKINNDTFNYQLSSTNTFTAWGYKIIVEVELSINNKNKYIRYDVTDNATIFEEVSTGNYKRLLLHNHIMYPDYRAKYIRILLYNPSTEIYKMAVYQKNTSVLSDAVFQLKSFPENNIAYYNEFRTISPYYYKQFITPAIKLLPDISGLQTYSAPEIDNLYVDYNRVQVSEQSNVFIYPAKNSYRFGEEDNRVVKLETVAEELSATRFGQFPVYVLTSQGIWSLEQGSGEILYSNITPIDYSPCNNPNSVCNINGGVVFATATGLKLIAGRKVIEISSPLEDLYINNPLLGIASYNQLLNTEAFTNLYDVVSKKDTFISKLRSVITSYNREFNELFVTMPVMPFNIWKRPSSDKDYSFVFNKDLRTWYKFKTQFVQFIRTFNGFHAQNFDGTYIKLTDIENETDSSQTFTNFFYQSREIKLENTSFKRLEHIVTRIFTKVNSYLKNITDRKGKYLRYNKWITLHIYGSPDAKEWKLVAGGKSDTTVIRDIMIRKTYASCRYFIFVICGDAKDVELSGFDIQFIDKYVSKIR